VLRRQLERWLDEADVAIDGKRPWDIQVHNSDLYGRVWAYGTLGAGEAYVEG